MENQESWRNVGNRIRMLRKANGLTLKQLANGCDLSSNAISLVERGEVAPTVVTLCKIAHALGVSASSLFQEICPTEVILTRAKGGTQGSGGTGSSGETRGSGETGSSGSQATHLAKEALSFLIDPAPPNSASEKWPSVCGPALPSQTALCVCGYAEYEVDERIFCMEPGDRLNFNGGAAHHWSNSGEETCVLILVIPPNHKNKGKQ